MIEVVIGSRLVSGTGPLPADPEEGDKGLTMGRRRGLK